MNFVVRTLLGYFKSSHKERKSERISSGPGVREETAAQLLGFGFQSTLTIFHSPSQSASCM